MRPMSTQPLSIRHLLTGLLLILAAAQAPLGLAEGDTLTVYKSPTCGCCGLWIDHARDAGFDTRVEHPADLNQLKAGHGIAPRHQSCHTAVSADGFVFEGHVPAHLIKRFLAERPEGAIGLAVPGMPVGSPGMEMGERFDRYEVLLLMKDGSSRVYSAIETAAEQYP